MRFPSPALLLATAAVLALQTMPSHAQTTKQPSAQAPGTDAVTTEALALFDRVCLAALGRRVPPADVAQAELRDATPVPAERLRTLSTVRETAAWRVRGQHGRYSVVMMEPGTQCGIFAEGVSPQGFLDAARQLMVNAERFPGWVRRGDPGTSVQQRPYGTLTYLRSTYTSILPPAGSPGGSGPSPLPSATVTASAADRTDGRPNTAVISTGFPTPGG